MLSVRIHPEIYQRLGLQFFADEENLNLLSEKDVRVLATNDVGRRFLFGSQRLLGLKSNTLVSRKKRQCALDCIGPIKARG
jgi:hypothetical protein